MCFLAVKTSLFSCSSTRTSSSSTCGSWWSSQDCQTVPRKTKEMSARSKKRSTFRDKKKRPSLVVREKNKSVFKRRSLRARLFSLSSFKLFRQNVLLSPPSNLRERGAALEVRESEREREDGSDTKGVCRFFFCLRKICTPRVPFGGDKRIKCKRTRGERRRRRRRRRRARLL